MPRAIPESVRGKFNRNLHMQVDHPIQIVKQRVIDYFLSAARGSLLVSEDLPREVNVHDNFDALRIPSDHPSRSESDTFYTGADTVLRTHTSAHQHALLKSGMRNFLVIGDVYRRDEVNRTHYPVFHQLEGVLHCGEENPVGVLCRLMTGLVTSLFPGHEYRINDDFFPFTTDGIEVEVLLGSQYIEILGGGVVHTEVKEMAGVSPSENLIAWGLGLERLAMILFSIPDIRLFWSEDPKFISQFSKAGLAKYVPFSLIEPVDRDISFFVNKLSPPCTWTRLNEFYELVQAHGDDMVESVTLYDKFFHPKLQKYSHTFRIRYSPVASCTNAADLKQCADSSMSQLRSIVADVFDVELR